MDIGDTLLDISFVLCILIFPLLIYISNNSEKAEEKDIIKKNKRKET